MFLTFEIAFNVIMPKGPLEAAFGYLGAGRWKPSELLLQGFQVLLTPKTLALMMVGLVLGIFVGVLPGLGGPNGVAILLPLTFTMDPTSAIVMLSCIYWGALFGGAITSILFNIPGEAWSVATTFDGYPMAQQGRAAEALTAAFTSSFIGSLVAVLLITFLAPCIADFALRFGPPEFFAVYLLTFCSFVGLGKEERHKIVISMALGLLLAGVGMDTVSGQLRMTFGWSELLRGVNFLVAVIGLFGISEILLTMEERLALRGHVARISLRVVLADLEDAAALLGDAAALGRHRLLARHHAGRRDCGLVHGLQPRQALRQGQGELRQGPHRGRVRAGNGGARRRHLGAAADAGARHSGLRHRRDPARRPDGVGPQSRARCCSSSTRSFVWGTIASMYLGNVVGLVLVLSTVPIFAAVLRVPFAAIAPMIVVSCAIGAYAIQNAMFDIWLMLIFGVVGYVFKKLDYPLAPLTLALVLGSRAEDSFRLSMIGAERRSAGVLVESARRLDHHPGAAPAVLAAHRGDARSPARRSPPAARRDPSRRRGERQRLVDQRLAARDLACEFIVDRLAGGAERRLVGLVDLHAGGAQLVEELAVERGGRRSAPTGCIALPTSTSALRHRRRQSRPAGAGGDVGRRIDVAGQRQIFLHFLEARRVDLRQRVFLRFHPAGLQRRVDFREGQRRRLGAIGLEHLHPPASLRHPELQSL